MKIQLIKLAALLLLATLNSRLSTLHAQGSLTPPGTPAPTMKTLDQIDAKLEKRTPISSLPFTISQSGSYYLTTNLTSGSFNYGILVLADNVTIDLNGFALIGVVNSFSGIGFFGQKNLCVRNGTIRNWDNDGILASPSFNSRFEDLFLTDNTTGGLLADHNALVHACMVSSNGGTGMQVGDGSHVSQCTAQTNFGYGFLIGRACTVTECAAVANTSIGIYAGDGSTLSGLTAFGNGSNGITTGDGCSVQGCTSFGNRGDGVHVSSGCTIRGCTVRSNQVNGLFVDRRCLVIDNLCDQTGVTNATSTGVLANREKNRIESNHLIAGSFFVGSTNLFIRNTIDSGGALGIGTMIGPYIYFGAGNGTDGAGTITNNNPWANIRIGN